jgi:hypothetical protein
MVRRSRLKTQRPLLEVPVAISAPPCISINCLAGGLQCERTFTGIAGDSPALRRNNPLSSDT